MARTKFNDLIFSLDDIGIDPSSDAVANSLITEGVVDHISIMIGSTLEPSLHRAIKESGVKKDIHLHLTGAEYEKALDTFLRRFLFMLKIYLSPKTRRAIHDAWDAQLTIFKETYGSSPFGINSHEHIHFIPPLFKLTVGLAQKHGVDYIRQGSELPRTHDYRALLLHFFQMKNRDLFSQSLLHTSTSLYSFDWEDRLVDLPAQSEIIFHPQYPADVTFLRAVGTSS